MSNSVLISILLVGLVATIADAANLKAATEEPEVCLARLEKRLESVEVPDKLNKIITGLRAINVTPPQLKEFSLNKLLDSARAELRIIETGIISSQEADEVVVPLCADYVGQKIQPAFEDTCDLQQFLQDDASYMEYLDVMQKMPELDRKTGAARICLML